MFLPLGVCLPMSVGNQDTLAKPGLGRTLWKVSYVEIRVTHTQLKYRPLTSAYQHATVYGPPNLLDVPMASKLGSQPITFSGPNGSPNLAARTHLLGLSRGSMGEKASDHSQIF